MQLCQKNCNYTQNSPSGKRLSLKLRRGDETKLAMEEGEQGKYLMAQGGVEQLHKREAPANQCVVNVDLSLSMTMPGDVCNKYGK